MRSARCRSSRLDCSKRDPRADSEMPNVSGRVHRALDRTRTFRGGSRKSASVINRCVRDRAGISRHQTGAPLNRATVRVARKLNERGISLPETNRKQRERSKMTIERMETAEKTTNEEITKANDIVAIARAAYEAYVAKNRAAIEKLIATDFRFTSPLDNRIDRATYFARCWANSENDRRLQIHQPRVRSRPGVCYLRRSHQKWQALPEHRDCNRSRRSDY